jgi:hypothetical protein
MMPRAQTVAPWWRATLSWLLIIPRAWWRSAEPRYMTPDEISRAFPDAPDVPIKPTMTRTVNLSETP